MLECIHFVAVPHLSFVERATNKGTIIEPEDSSFMLCEVGFATEEVVKPRRWLIILCQGFLHDEH